MSSVAVFSVLLTVCFKSLMFSLTTIQVALRRQSIVAQT